MVIFWNYIFNKFYQKYKNSIDRGKWVCHNYTNTFHFLQKRTKLYFVG